MYGASLKRQKYVMVERMGIVWEVGGLEDNSLWKAPMQISAREDLQKVFEVLNW